MERRDEKTQSRRPGGGIRGRGGRGGDGVDGIDGIDGTDGGSRGDGGAFARAESRWSRGGSRGGRVCVATRAVVPGARPGFAHVRPRDVPPDGIRRYIRSSPVAAPPPPPPPPPPGADSTGTGRPTPGEGTRPDEARRREFEPARRFPAARERPGEPPPTGRGRASIGCTRTARGAHREGAHARCERRAPRSTPRRPSEGDRDVRPNASARRRGGGDGVDDGRGVFPGSRAAAPRSGVRRAATVHPTPRRDVMR